MSEENTTQLTAVPETKSDDEQGDLALLEKCRRPQDFTAQLAVDKIKPAPSVRKPGRDFFSVHPDPDFVFPLQYVEDPRERHERSLIVNPD